MKAFRIKTFETKNFFTETLPFVRLNQQVSSPKPVLKKLSGCENLSAKSEPIKIQDGHPQAYMQYMSSFLTSDSMKDDMLPTVRHISMHIIFSQKKLASNQNWTMRPKKKHMKYRYNK